MKRALLVLVLVVGCGDGVDIVGETCAPREGLYRSEVVRLTGECSGLSGSTFDPNNEELPASCTAASPAPTSCTTAYDVTCASDQGTYRTRGAVRWARDGLSATGVIEVAEPGCTATWRLTYTKVHE